MEMDYRLVENEGLFQEYLEMGNTYSTIMHLFRLNYFHFPGNQVE